MGQKVKIQINNNIKFIKVLQQQQNTNLTTLLIVNDFFRYLHCDWRNDY